MFFVTAKVFLWSPFVFLFHVPTNVASSIFHNIAKTLENIIKNKKKDDVTKNKLYTIGIVDKIVYEVM